MDVPQKSERNATFYIGKNDRLGERDGQHQPISFLNASSPKKTSSALANLSTTSSSANLVYNVQKISVVSFEEQKSPWASLWLSNIILMFAGLQFSIYFTSMWPFLQTLDKSTTLGFFGIMVATYSIGQAVASPIFGYWNQKAKSTRRPVMMGMVLTIIGNLIYGLLPTFSDNRKWIMLVARFIVGFGSGVVGVLRAYLATASTSKDRTKAVALGIAGFVLGIGLGPATQACFQPIGEEGWSIGSVKLNMYTLPSYFIILGALIVIALLQFVFVENYAGIMSDEQKKANPYMVLPKVDYTSALVCIYIWFIQQTMLTASEVISAPFTMAMYGWTKEQAVLYNGIIQFVAAVVNIVIYMLHAFTRIGNYDSRKLILFGLISFFCYHIATLPWPFFSGPLRYQNLTANITGGCETSYEWCAHTTSVPLPIYIVCYVVFLGLAFPNVASPLGTLYSRILGPRKQGNMQGVYMFTGSFARFLGPLFITNMFEWYGPMLPWATQAALIASGVLLILVSYKRLVPLKTVPRLQSGDKIKYKLGTLYRM